MIKDIPYNYKIDIWALGVLLYELNHGKAPFPADSIDTIKLRF
jgi:serine/threonine protein kinase